MVQRPTSPSSLLWSHQLKREHLSLEQRVEVSEKNVTKLDTRMLALETGQQTGREQLKEQETRLLEHSTLISSIEKDDEHMKHCINQLSADRTRRLQEVDRNIKILTTRVETLETQERKTNDRPEDGHDQQQEMIERIGELETSVETLSRGRGKLMKKSDNRIVETLEKRMDVLEARRTEDLQQVKHLRSQVSTLQESNTEWQTRYKKLEEKMSTTKPQNDHSESRLHDLQTTPQSEEGRHSTPPSQSPVQKGNQRILRR
ncbi:uncharacterized protein K452DRAFT_304643 [Aplosporella prunicola CBS 121167]|uniref:Uncharacterized protein n=1 Tax=Aplosporella prunicola CBS 121167 TaxID=1176127 RepID=A0A6A6BRH3_9PEZI|nr:uncharacterized protein K452DRAFT_304643 [Aplosporella prunicola CBS 121167]KAF2146702.1 hypothetical protein K452DRAFT_304643 [Aplosporella prunicola CBS 121167]